MFTERQEDFSRLFDRRRAEPLRLAAVLWLVVCVILLTGCGGSESFVFTSPGGGEVARNSNALVRFQHVLAREVPSSVSAYRISGFDSLGNLVFVPEDFPKVAELVVEMPPSVTNVAILYLDDSDNPQGAFLQEVQLVAGQTATIFNPDSVYASGSSSPPPTSTTWHNDDCPLDVNADGVVTPIDASTIISDLNQNGSRRLTEFTSQPFPPPPFLDVNGDGSVSASDVLPIINGLNSGNVPNCPAAVVPTKLVFQTQPQDVVAGATMTPISVRVVDENDQLARKNFSQVTISFVDAGGQTLSGTTTKTALKGVVVFDDLSVNQSGTQVFQVESGSLNSAQSETFTILDSI
jgi:Dockerin type I domain